MVMFTGRIEKDGKVLATNVRGSIVAVPPPPHGRFGSWHGEAEVETKAAFDLMRAGLVRLVTDDGRAGEIIATGLKSRIMLAGDRATVKFQGSGSFGPQS